MWHWKRTETLHAATTRRNCVSLSLPLKFRRRNLVPPPQLVAYTAALEALDHSLGPAPDKALHNAGPPNHTHWDQRERDDKAHGQVAQNGRTVHDPGRPEGSTQGRPLAPRFFSLG